MSELAPASADYSGMHGDIVALLEAARRTAARSVNALMTASYWEIGRRIVEFEQGGQDRAAYGAALLKHLSGDLTTRFGRGFGVVNLQQMRNFYLAWPTEQIYQTVSDKLAARQIPPTLSAQLSSSLIAPTPFALSADLPALALAFPLPWSAYVRLLSVKNEQARSFYETEALRGGWSVRQLDRQIGSQFYERTTHYRHSRAGGNPETHIDRGNRDGRKATCRVHPCQSTQRDALHRRHLQLDQAHLGTQEQRRRRFHQKLRRAHSGVLRATRHNGGSHHPREAAQEVESCMETQAYRRTQSRLARSMAGYCRIDDCITSLTAVFTSAVFIGTPEHTLIIPEHTLIIPAPTLVTPAKAGAQKAATEPRTLDSRLRGNDRVFERSLRELDARRLGSAGDAEGAE